MPSKMTDDWYRQAARVSEKEGDLEFDDVPVVSRNDDGDDGAYVQCWVWVPDGTPWDVAAMRQVAEAWFEFLGDVEATEALAREFVAEEGLVDEYDIPLSDLIEWLVTEEAELPKCRTCGNAEDEGHIGHKFEG
jgi:hypothetical protein